MTAKGFSFGGDQNFASFVNFYFESSSLSFGFVVCLVSHIGAIRVS